MRPTSTSPDARTRALPSPTRRRPAALLAGAAAVANHSQRCLRISGNSFAIRAQVVQGSCGSKSARRRRINHQNDGAFESRLASLRNRDTGKCIGLQEDAPQFQQPPTSIDGQ